MVPPEERRNIVLQTLWEDCFLHLRFESNSAIEQDEASLAHIARRNPLSWDSFTASRAGKTNLYQNLHVHVHWTWQHKISIPFRWRKIIPNSANQNGIGRFPDFSSPLAEWKVWHARLLQVHVVSVAFVLVLCRALLIQPFPGTHISVSHIIILPTSSFAHSATACLFAT